MSTLLIIFAAVAYEVALSCSAFTGSVLLDTPASSLFQVYPEIM
jgi:hypothetical protein